VPAEKPHNWSEVLDRFEQQLEAYRACLLGGELPEPYSLPIDLGSIPRELVPRARELLELNRGIEAAIEARRNRLALALVGRSRPIEPVVDPAFIDARV
jgi:hypothetical protein